MTHTLVHKDSVEKVKPVPVGDGGPLMRIREALVG